MRTSEPETLSRTGHKAACETCGTSEESYPIMSAATPKPTQNDWVKTVLFDRGYLAESAARPSRSIWRSSRPAAASPTGA